MIARRVAAAALAGLIGWTAACTAPDPTSAETGPSDATTTAASSPTASAVASTPGPTIPVPTTPAASTPVPSTPASTSTIPSAAPSSPAATTAPPPTPGTASVVATGLTSPWGLAVADDGSLLVSERDTGLIRHVRDGETRTVTTVGDVVPANEGGLLGIVLSPDRRALFAYHTTGRDNRITRYAWDGTRLSDPTVILSRIPYASNHDGGRMVTGPDGLLYVGTGDALRPQNAQDRSSLAGKILRITVAGEPAPGNPYGNAVFSLGHRNVQGLAFDDRGRLWASEFGDKSADELNLITRGGNYGWPRAEGPSDTDGLIDPVRTWDTDDASPSGLAFARGSLWMAGLRGERLWQIPLGAGSSTGAPQAHLVEQYGRLRSVTMARDGALLVSTSNTDGRGDVRDGDDRVLRLPLG